jgi:hypothetical protein
MHRNILGAAALLALTLGCVSTVSTISNSQDRYELLAIIDEIEKGWEQGDGAPFVRHFLDFAGARYVESGGQNEGLSDLVDHHVVPEKEALELFLNFENVETHIEGDFAWAVADVEVKATVRSSGRVIDKRGYETFLFRRVMGTWRVVHTHSSTRDVKPK